MIQSFNPANGEFLCEVSQTRPEDIETRLAAAKHAQRRWAAMDVASRAGFLQAVAIRLRANSQALARLITLEMGKPIKEAEAEIEKCAWNFEYYSERGPDFLRDHIVESGATDSRIVYDPLGLILAVMPWNYPFWQVMRAAAPILLGGNGLVLKHASNVPQCALAIERLFEDAGFPIGLVTTLIVKSGDVPKLIRHAHVAAVTFTGSTPVGRDIAADAGRALKKQVLELGGTDAFIVLADADIEAAASAAVRARFQNTGQSCIAAKRFIVEASVADRFVESFRDRVERLVVGDPMDPLTDQGSMAKLGLRTELDGQVQASIAQGAKLVLGGHAIAGPGAFYHPTILDHVDSSMIAAREETFGPAAAILRVLDADDAVCVANDTPFGLAAAVWTQDLDRAVVLTRSIEVGAVFVNGIVASDPRLPFGGVKASGYGRELGVLGLHEFMNAKTVWTGPQRR